MINCKCGHTQGSHYVHKGDNHACCVCSCQSFELQGKKSTKCGIVLENQTAYVVTLDINGVDIYSADYYVVASSPEEARAIVHGWAQGHFYNPSATKVREATEEEEKSPKFWR